MCSTSMVALLAIDVPSEGSPPAARTGAPPKPEATETSRNVLRVSTTSLHPRRAQPNMTSLAEQAADVNGPRSRATLQYKTAPLPHLHYLGHEALTPGNSLC